MLAENLRALKNITWSDVNEVNYARFLLTSYENYIETYSKYNLVSIAEAKEKIAPPDVRKGSRDIWRYIFLDKTEVGYIWVTLKKDGKSAFLMDIHFYPEFRGNGFGRRVMEMLKDSLRSMGVEGLELYVFRQNTAAVQLYEKLGLKEVTATNNSLKMHWYFTTP